MLFNPMKLHGLLGYESNNLMQRIAQTLAGKWTRSYSQIYGLVRAGLSIAIARAADPEPRHTEPASAQNEKTRLGLVSLRLSIKIPHS